MSATAYATETKRRPLEGVRVLDLSHVVSGPYASLVLANLGAEVIQVKQPSGGRRSQPTGRLTEAEGFEWGMNRNKRSIAINLKSEEGRGIIRGLVAQSDIIFSNFRPGKLESLGLGNAALREINPGLISCELNGFGSVGPWATMPAYDPIIQAMSGTMSFTGSADPDDMPVRWTVPIADIFAGLFAAIGMLAALIERGQTGRGRHVEIAMHDVMLALNSYRVPLALSFGEVPVPQPNEGGQGTVPYGTFEGADGKWLAIGVSDRMWEAACTVIGRDDLAQQDDLKRNAGRWERREEITQAFREALRKKPAAHWEAALLDKGVIAGRVNSIADLLEHPQMRARDMIHETRDDQGRAITVIGDPLHWTGGDAVKPPVPLGADSRIVLGQLLGLSDDRLDALEAAGVIETAATGAGTTPLSARTWTAPSTAAASPRGPLGHLTILEMDGDEPSKGFAGHILRDLGAVILKVRRPADDRREPYPNLKREAAYRASLDAGKDYAEFNIKSREGRDGFLALAKTADAVIDNYRVGVADRLGITPDVIQAANPRIVTCSITGYGQSGPWARYPAFDAAIQALGGGMSLAPIPDSMGGEPVRWGMPIGGLNGSLYAVIGVLAGIVEAGRDGTARRVDIALLDAQAALLCYRVPQAASGIAITATPRRGGTGAVPFGPFRAADRKWFTICITQQFWKRFAKEVGGDALADEPRYATEALRREHEDELNPLIEQLMAKQSSDHWAERFAVAEIPGATVVNLAEAFEHPNVALHDMKVVVPDPEFDSIWIAGNPIKVS